MPDAKIDRDKSVLTRQVPGPWFLGKDRGGQQTGAPGPSFGKTLKENKENHISGAIQEDGVIICSKSNIGVRARASVCICRPRCFLFSFGAA